MDREELKAKLESLNTKINEIALQKRLEVEAEHLKRIKCTRFIRLFGSSSGSSFRVNTRILNETGVEEKTPFWSLVKRVCICINTNFSADGTPSNKSTMTPRILEWTRESETDAFIVPLNDECENIQILVKLANQRSVYRLNPPLAALLGRDTDTKHNIIKDIYKYVNGNKLNDYVTSNINCDPLLESVFGVKSFNFSEINTLVEPHLHPIFYCVIDVDSKNSSDVEIWDIEVETDDLSQMPVLFPKHVQQLEKKIEDIRLLKKRVTERISLLDEFHKDPALFINKKIALDSEGPGLKSAFYDDPNVQTALFELIKKKEP